MLYWKKNLENIGIICTPHVEQQVSVFYVWMQPGVCFCSLKDCGDTLSLQNLFSENIFGYSASQSCWKGISCVIWREDEVCLEACLARRTRVASSNALVFPQHQVERGCRREKKCLEISSLVTQKLWRWVKFTRAHLPIDSIRREPESPLQWNPW